MKQSILEAAKSLLWERGYEAMSPRAVMDASGAGQGSLYHHFGSKKDLAVAAITEVSGELTDRIEQFFRTDLPPLDRVRAYLLHERDGLKGCRLGRLAQEASIQNTPELRDILAAHFAELETHILDALNAAVADNELPPDLDAGKISKTIIATVQGGYVLSRATGDANAVAFACQGLSAMIDGLVSANRA